MEHLQLVGHPWHILEPVGHVRGLEL